ncbi:MAG: multiheme c-type cytochrome, partial [Thermoanaerobaculia bacterium]
MKRGMVFALATAALATIAAAQQPAPAPAPAPVAPVSKPGQYAGVASCVSSGCHGSTHPLKESRILQNEYYTWLNRDRHPKSYNVLFNERSARIVRNMRLKKKAYEETMCLDCHSMNVAKGMVSGRVEIEDGVQCEACHGPGSRHDLSCLSPRQQGQRRRPRADRVGPSHARLRARQLHGDDAVALDFAQRDA